MTLCIVINCNKKALAFGLCRQHYDRKKKNPHIPLEQPFKLVTPQEHCNIVGCNRKHRARGFCGKHYYSFKTYGDPLAARGRSSNPTKCYKGHTKTKSGKNGYLICPECDKETSKKYYEEHKDKRKVSMKKWLQSEKGKRYSQSEEYKQYQKNYYKNILKPRREKEIGL